MISIFRGGFHLYLFSLQMLSPIYNLWGWEIRPPCGMPCWTWSVSRARYRCWYSCAGIRPAVRMRMALHASTPIDAIVGVRSEFWQIAREKALKYVAFSWYMEGKYGHLQDFSLQYEDSQGRIVARTSVHFSFYHNYYEPYTSCSRSRYGQPLRRP